MNPDRQRPEDVWVDEHAGPVVRPYAMTRGRTRPTQGPFDLISLVVATRPAPAVEVGLGPEHIAIIRLCQQPLSVAEIAARLDLPVGTIRVLLGDLLDKAFVVVREPGNQTVMSDNSIFEAVLDGLRAL